MTDIWNPWHGCRKISEACLNCYMFQQDAERGKDGSEIYRVKTNFNLPIKRNRQGRYKIQSGTHLRVCLTSDFFLEEADVWREEAWAMMRERSDVYFRLLTKRPQRVPECLPQDWGNGWKNVFLSVTAENQKRADERIPILINLPFLTKGILCTPLLSKIDMEDYLATGGIDFVYTGGENHAGARPTDYSWHRDLYEQCVRQNVAFKFWDTGAEFIKDGKLFKVPPKRRHEQARKSGLYYTPVLY